jgi:primosomal replication protein N
MVSGQFRSYNRHEEQKNRLVLSVFAREMEFIEEEPDGAKTNHILLEGYMCKTPVYRKTPLGREIADLLLAVNLTGNQIISLVSAGEETHGTHRTSM